MNSFYSEAEALEVWPLTHAFEVDDIHSHLRNRLTNVFKSDIVSDIANIKVSSQVGSSPRDKALNDLFANDDVGDLARTAG